MTAEIPSEQPKLPTPNGLWQYLSIALLAVSVALAGLYYFKQADYTDAQIARINEAYVFEHYFCTDNVSEVTHSDAETTVDGLKITSNIHCVQNNGNVKSFEVVFDQQNSALRITGK